MTGAQRITIERERQKSEERWTAKHDDNHTTGELARAAIAYLLSHVNPLQVAQWWPWEWSWYKPQNNDIDGKIINLTKAGALVAAEIDRLERLKANP